MQINVSITSDHIGRGEPCNGGACAAALAITEAMGGQLDFINVTTTDVTLSLNGKRLVGELPSVAKDFVAEFDDRGHTLGDCVQPLTFPLTLVG